MARRRYGKTRLAFDRSVRAAQKNPDEEQRLDPDLDAGLVASGRALADHLDNTLEAAVERLEEFAIVAQPDEARALAESIEKLSQRIDKAIYTTPHLMNVLREMYATPKARVDATRARERSAVTATPEGIGGTVDKFRAIAGGKSG